MEFGAVIRWGLYLSPPPSSAGSRASYVLDKCSAAALGLPRQIVRLQIPAVQVLWIRMQHHTAFLFVNLIPVLFSFLSLLWET